MTQAAREATSSVAGTSLGESTDLLRPRAPWFLPIAAGVVLIVGAVAGFGFLAGAALVALEIAYFVFFARHMAFALVALDTARSDLDGPAIRSGVEPTVSVIVAGKNEEAVIARLARSLAALDYPADRIQFLIVDDGSTDRTGAILDEIAEADPRFVALHRPLGAGGAKSAALNTALKVATGEVIVVFDADHEPRPDVIWRLSRHFADPEVAAVQGRCAISNASDSPLARLVWLDYLAGYLVNEYGRQALFELPAYGGANCAVRASSLRLVGGWNEQSVTEDTDLTLRLKLSGFSVRYDVSAVDEEEGVVSLDRYWRQRYRWARGHQQVWRDYSGTVWRSKHLTFAEKIETTLFLLVFHIPVVSGMGLALLGLWFAGAFHPFEAGTAFFFWTLLLLGPMLEMGSGLLIAKADRRNAFYLLLFVPIYFVTIALCTKAWIDGLLGRPYTWSKTMRGADPRVPAGAVR